MSGKRWRVKPLSYGMIKRTITRVTPSSGETVEVSQEMGPVLTSSTVETMGDIVGSPTTYNPVTHWKVTHSGSGAPRYDVLKEVGKSSDPPSHEWHEYSSYACSEIALPNGPSPAQMQGFVNDALENATEQIPESVGIANALYELREVGEMIVIEWTGNLAKLLAGQFLSWEFGWKPLLEDIKKTLNVVRDVRKRLEHLRKTHGKPTTIHFSKPYKNEFIALNGPFQPPSNDGSEWFEATMVPHLVEEGGVMTATFVVLNQLEGINDAIAFAKALENALGLNNIVDTLWQGMPFSWFIEYFINVGRTLKAIEVEPFKGKISVLSAGYSVKAEAKYDCYALEWYYEPYTWEIIVPYPPFKITGGGIRRKDEWKVKGKIEAKHYQRRRGFPAPAWIFLEDRFTPHQLAILLALLLSGGRDE